MMTEQIFDAVLKIAISIIALVFTTYIIPWLKDKNLYNKVCRFVKAAEKIAETQKIDKKKFVCGALEKCGVKIDDKIDNMIECAVMELDIAIAEAFINLDINGDVIPINDETADLKTVG